MWQRIQEYRALIIIAFVSLFLRVYGLTNESLWLDEGYSVSLAKADLAGIAHGTAADVHPPLYYFTLHYWMLLWGDSEIAVRLLSALLGVVAVIMIYQVAQLLFDKTTAIISALLLALAGFHIQYAQEVRMYALLALITLCSIYFLLRLCKESSKKLMAGYLIFSTLVLYTHIYGAFVLIVENLYVLTLFLVARDKLAFKFKHWVALQASIGLLFTPWLFVLLDQVTRVQQGFWIPPPTWLSLYHTLLEYTKSYWLLVLFVSLLGLAVVYYGPSRQRQFEKFRFAEFQQVYLLSLWLLVPILLPFVISNFSPSIFSPKYTIPASLAFYLLVARAIRLIPHSAARFAVLALVVWLCANSLQLYYNARQKEQWREATQTIEQMAQPGDLIVFNDGMCQRYGFDYYARRTDVVKREFNLPEIAGPDKESAVAGAIGQHRRVWLVLSHSNQAGQVLKESLNRTHKALWEQIWIGIEAQLYER